ncbi:MAG: hypothetical protein ACP5E3_00435 [Bacteroidales bacterium]
MNINKGLNLIKTMIEEVIIENGEAGKKSVINSSRTINILHEVVKSDLIKAGVNPDLIRPALGSTKPEIQLAGFMKFKTQDVCVFPNHLTPIPEPIEFNGLHSRKIDPYGELFSEHILAVNLRSQLSSLAKNKDTMYERTYAEPLNLHRRLPKMVLGEVYLLSARELDSNAVKANKVVYKPVTIRSSKALEEYIYGFAALNKRVNQGDDFFKYERVALLIVDFSKNPLKIYETSEALKADGLLTADSECTLEKMTYKGFIDDLLAVYERRFGTGILS